MNEYDKDASGHAAPGSGPVESFGSASGGGQSMGSAPGPQQSMGSAPGPAPAPPASRGRGLVIGGVVVILLVIAAIIGFAVK